MSRLQQNGFTIIEVLVALTIGGILLALGVPAMSGYIQSARLVPRSRASTAGCSWRVRKR